MSHDEVATPTSNQDHHSSPIYTALARTTTRAITLYFARPVRLFRPSKGKSNTMSTAFTKRLQIYYQYIVSLIKSQGVFVVIPKHFMPPMLANAALGTVLWTTYTESSGYLESRFGHHSIFAAALSGAAAGGMQALAAAPVENARLVIEGGTGKGWSHAWKEVFRATQSPHTTNKSAQIRNVRKIRLWMKDVREMAGRGWAGWGWGFGKDICGFAAFFTVFEITRQVANEVKLATRHAVQLKSRNHDSHSHHLSRFAHAFTLVCGGMMAGFAYEILCRPWDIARRVIALERSITPHSNSRRSSFSVLMQVLRRDGITSVFRGHFLSSAQHPEIRSSVHARISTVLRTLARVGPWGVAFLVWESLSPGLD